MKLPRVYVINLDRSTDRLKDFRQSFESLGLDVVRVVAVDGKAITLPHPDYDERNYLLYHGGQTSMGVIGCYFSHIKALRQFLETDEETALICEDDVSAKPELPQVLHEILQFKKHWDLLRMVCWNIPSHIPVRKLDNGSNLTVPICLTPPYWAMGAGAYLVNRKAAERIITSSIPMYLPYDHALDQNWRMGLTAMMVSPFPIAPNEHVSNSTINQTDQIIHGKRRGDKLPFFQRYLFSPILPYRGFTTCQRWRKQIGTALWYLLFPPKRMDEDIAE